MFDDMMWSGFHMVEWHSDSPVANELPCKADQFVKKNPNFTEISDRKIIQWALMSGIKRPQVGKEGPKDTVDAPIMNFGFPYTNYNSYEMLSAQD